MPALLSQGKIFSGPVVYVGDGDSLCVDVGSNSQPEKPTRIGPFSTGASWVEVRLGDFYAAELHEPGGESAKQALVGVAMHRKLVCRASHRSYDRVVASCRRDGVLVSDLLRKAGAKEGGRGR